MTKSIKLIALDMDGTLLTPALEVSKRNKDAIKEALNQGIHVVLSTGRGIQTCYPYAEELGLQSYLITANGGQIWTMEKELLRQQLLPLETVKALDRIVKEMDVRKWMISTEHIFRDEDPVDIPAYEWLKFGCASENLNKLDQVRERLKTFDDLELTNSLPTNIEINPKGVSKAKALHFVCDRIGITMNEIMAVGDSLNDIKMIQEAGIGVAMGNAQDKILEIAAFVTDTNESDGVGKAIEKFALK